MDNEGKELHTAGKTIECAPVIACAPKAVDRIVKVSETDGYPIWRRYVRECEQTQITVNVNVQCPAPGAPGATGTSPGVAQRPTHRSGTSDGSIDAGLGARGGVTAIPQRPPSVWPGPRTKLYLPFLFVRATVGDTAARPIAGVFWESPDIFVLPGVKPQDAPPLPPNLGGTAQASADNTVYAHVWNLGQAPAYGAFVEFYWFDPALGFKEGEQHLIGFDWVDLGPRGGFGSHKVVKCPVSWPAQYVNGGHECLVVRISQPVADPLSSPAWDASQNRHIGQRNIHVMSAAEAAAKPTLGIKVGPLYDQAAQVGVARAQTATMPWLHLVTNDRAKLLGTGVPTGDVGITAPLPAGVPLPNLGGIPNPRGTGLIGDGHGVAADGQQVGFITTDGNPGAGNAHVYRVSASQNGTAFGGYTVVVLGA
jgi:hypothetical protein